MLGIPPPTTSVLTLLSVNSFITQRNYIDKQLSTFPFEKNCERSVVLTQKSFKETNHPGFDKVPDHEGLSQIGSDSA